MAGDKVTIALVGIHGRGKTMAQWFGALPDVRIPVVCDVDAVVVALPDHWLKFDSKTETIAGDAEANRLLSREYRTHWATPKKA